MLENFGFRVLEERPSALTDGLGYLHDFSVEIGAGSRHRRDPLRVPEIERAISNVMCGVSEDDEFNQLVLYAALDTQPWCGSEPGFVTCAKPEAASD